jgi:hypothetical protein
MWQSISWAKRELSKGNREKPIIFAATKDIGFCRDPYMIVAQRASRYFFRKMLNFDSREPPRLRLDKIKGEIHEI